MALNKNTKVILNANSDIGKVGNYGFRTNLIAKHCYKNKVLKKVYCRDYVKSGIPDKYFKTVGKVLRTIGNGLTGINYYIYPKFQAWRVRRDIYDAFMSKNDMSCDIFHTWEHCPKMIKKAKASGAIVIRELHVGFTLNDNYNLDADYIICQSRYHYIDGLRFGFKKERLILNPSGVDIKKFKPSKKKNKLFTCIYVGNLEERKGVEYVLKAWKGLNLKDAQLLMIGRKNKNTDSIIKKYSIDSVKFLGLQPANKVAKLMRESHVFVFPSFREGAAKVTYEAMASGLPLITTDEAGSLVESGKDGFIVPEKNSDEIKKRIKYFYNNRKEITKMGKAARKKVEKYPWDNFEKRVLKIYEDVLKKKKSGEFKPFEKSNDHLKPPKKLSYFDPKVIPPKAYKYPNIK